MTRHYNPAKQIFEQDDESEDRITCNRCNESGLHWKMVPTADGMGENAVLFNERNRRHVCPGPSEDDFSEVVE